MDGDSSPVRVRLFGEVDIEGDDVDPSVKLRPLSRGLLARLALARPEERLDTEELAKALVIKVGTDVPVAASKLSSAQQQLRNAQWELRKRMGEERAATRLLGAGRRWVALDGVRTDYDDFIRAADGGDAERAREISARGAFLPGIDDPWTAPYRRAVEQRLSALEPVSSGGVPRSDPPAGGGRMRALAAIGAALAVAGVVGVVAFTRDSEAAPDAAHAPPDIASDDTPVQRAERPAGRCEKVLPGVQAPEVAKITAGDRVVGEVKTYYQTRQHRMCAKLIKPEGSPFHGKMTHMALTVCGDESACAHDWHPYRIDAGPVVVASDDGCVSWRVSMTDQAGAWPVRDQLGRTAGCA